MPYKNLELKKAYLLRHREEKRAKDAEYREKNREKLREYFRSSVVKEKRKEYHVGWRASRVEHRAEYRKKWNAANPDKVHAQQKRRRQKYAVHISEYLRLIYPRRAEICKNLFRDC